MPEEKIKKIIAEYLNQKNVPAHLVIETENDIDKAALQEMGFEERDGLWVISKEEAMSILGISPLIDWDLHWKLEGERWLDLLPELG